MNKKRFLIFSFAFVCIAAMIIFFLFFFPKSEPVVTLLTAEEEEDVGEFYYRAVPGLKMAENAGLIRPVNKRLDLPGRDTALNIDRIWYNNENIVLFYHVEEMPREVYLGGELYLPSAEPVEKTAFHGTASIGGPNEKGILYQGGFYSCLRLPLLRDNSGKAYTEIETLSYTPFLTIPGQEEKETSETVQLKSFDIVLNYRSDQETVVKIPAESQMELDPERIHFYQVDMAPSVTRIYFQYLNSGRDRVYRVKGSYTTDKGESYGFDSYPAVITDYPYHYSIEVPPFHIPPESLQLRIDSVHLIGGDSVSFQLDTGSYSAKNHTYDADIGKDRIKETDIGIRQIALDPQTAEVFVKYGQEEESTKPYKKLEVLAPNWYTRRQDSEEKQMNQLVIRDHDFKPYDLDRLAYGAECQPGKGIRIRMSREFWDASDKIFLDIRNLSYVYEIDRDITVKLEYEK